jgi:peptidoglycan/LPS O-acetylase OafA/YrhL
MSLSLHSTNITEAMRRPYDNFTVLRLALALAVVVSHAFSVGTGRHLDEPLTSLTGYTLGEHAVNGFFAVSGFLVAMSWDRRGGAIPFVAARLLRVIPALVVAVLLTGLLLGAALTSLPRAQYLADGRVWNFILVTLTTFKSATVLPGVFENNPLRWPISTVWTLRYELICYAGLLGYGVVGGFKKPWIALVAAITVAIALIFLGLKGEIPKGTETALRLPLVFGTGSLIYLYRDRVLLSWPLLIAVFIAVIASVFVFKAAYKPILFAGTAYVMLFLALAPGLSHPSFEPPGDISYGVYLYGWPIQQALQSLFPLTSLWLMLPIALASTCAVSILSWIVVEKPALRLKGRIMAAR